MFRFLLGFTYVLSVLIQPSKSSPSGNRWRRAILVGNLLSFWKLVLASFNEQCSENRLCSQPLICSDRSQCVCSKPASVWNENFNDCFYCPAGWTVWENNRCLSFAVPTGGGLSYERANETCRSFSAQLLSLNNIAELNLFEFHVDRLLRNAFSSAVSLYFRLGAWIDRLHSKSLFPFDLDGWLKDKN